MRLFIVLCFCLALSSCAKAPPTLTPVGVADWNSLQLVHNLDLIRDLVDAGAKQTPPVFSRDVDVKVATWHKAALQTLLARGSGWKGALTTGLNQLLAQLSPPDREKLTPYVLLINTVLASIATPGPVGDPPMFLAVCAEGCTLTPTQAKRAVDLCAASPACAPLLQGR